MKYDKYKHDEEKLMAVQDALHAIENLQEYYDVEIVSDIFDFLDKEEQFLICVKDNSRKRKKL